MSNKFISFLFISTILMNCSAINLKKSEELISSANNLSTSEQFERCGGSLVKFYKDCLNGGRICCLINESCQTYIDANGAFKYKCV